MVDLIYFIILILLGYFIGSYIEKRHYKSIDKRETELLYLPVVSGKNFLEEKDIEKAELVYGSVVVSIDYFKLVLFGLRNFIGGEVLSLETVIDRARREAILRLKEKVKDADMILNLKVETSRISWTASEVLAYGTAIYYKK